MHGPDTLRSAIHDASDPLVVMRRVVEQAAELIGAGDGAALELISGGELRYVCGAGTLAGFEGQRLSLETSLGGLAVRSGQTLYCQDCSTDERADQEACRRMGTRSLVCVPLRQGATAVGALKVVAERPRAFTSHDVSLLARLADFVSAAIAGVWELSRAATALMQGPEMAAGDSSLGEGIARFVANVLEPRLTDELEVRRRIADALTGRRFHMLCQPIVEIQTGRLLGAEALARFTDAPPRPPDGWFAEAYEVGLGVALELAAVAVALTLLDSLPADTFVAVNVGPQALVSPELTRLIADSRPERIVIEVTEHIPIEDYGELHAALADMRALGVRLAIDDTGAGFASLGHILNLAPDLIKLDRQFGHRIDADPVRRAVAQSLVSLARDTGAEVIAEGIETTAELDTICELGIPYGQGYLFSRPCPSVAVPTRFPRRRREPDVFAVESAVAGRG